MEKRAISWRQLKFSCAFLTKDVWCGNRDDKSLCKSDYCPIWKRLPQLAKDSD